MKQMGKKIKSHNTCEQDRYNSRISDLHSLYEIKTEEGKTADVTLLIIHFGILCRSALDRLNHGVDGFVIAIQHNGRKFRVFRKIQCENQRAYPQLRLLKS